MKEMNRIRVLRLVIITLPCCTGSDRYSIGNTYLEDVVWGTMSQMTVEHRSTVLCQWRDVQIHKSSFSNWGLLYFKSSSHSQLWLRIVTVYVKTSYVISFRKNSTRWIYLRRYNFQPIARSSIKVKSYCYSINGVGPWVALLRTRMATCDHVAVSPYKYHHNLYR